MSSLLKILLEKLLFAGLNRLFQLSGKLRRQAFYVNMQEIRLLLRY